jgi:hypothetical protein
MTTFTTEDRIKAIEPLKRPKDGSKWAGTGRDVFHVLHTIELDGHIWVHYIKETIKEDGQPREFSCYLESFLQRFSELPE